MDRVQVVKDRLKEYRDRDAQRKAETARKFAAPPDPLLVAHVIFDYGLDDDIAEELLALPSIDDVYNRATELKSGT